MQTRCNRNPGNGYKAARSGSSSQEGLTRGGPGFSKSESGRGFDKSFSCNQRQNRHRNFHRPPLAPPGPARADVFIEVGRLAAEYLVSQGVLPPGVLPAKWQNGSLKKRLSEFQEFRSHEEENMRFPGDARTSVLDHLGDTSLGGEAGRRKYDDDYGTEGPRNHVRGKRKGGSSRNYGSDWGREYGRTCSWSDRHRDRTSPSRDLELDGSSRRREEHPVGRDPGERRAEDYDPSPGFHEQKQFVTDDDRMDVDQETRSKLREEQLLCRGDNDMSELTGTCATPPEGMDDKDSEPEIKGQQIEQLSEMKENVVKDDATNGDSLDLESSLRMTDDKFRTSGEADDVDPRNGEEITRDIIDPGKDETVKEIIVSGDPTCGNFAMHESVSANNSDTDLKKALCKLANVPTRKRSSLAKGAKRRSVFNVKGIDHIGPTKSTVNRVDLGVSTNDGSSDGCDEPKVLNSEIPTDLTPQAVDEEKGLHFQDAIEPARELESGNSLGDGIPGSASLLDQASDAGPDSSKDGMLENNQSFKGRLHGSGSEDPAVEKIGEKRHHGGIDMDGQHAGREDCSYQSRLDWLSPDSTNADECSNLMNPVNNRVDVIGDSISSGDNETMVIRGCSDNNIKLPEATPERNFMDTDEKQFFPSLFKICDLNLLEPSDGHDNQVQDAIFMYPSGASVKKSDSPIDINLSICNLVTPVENGELVAGGKEVKIVDLEGDSAPEDKSSGITERRAEDAFMETVEFSNPAPDAADNPDSRDGYGLMISELLANYFPNPVAGDVNPPDNVGLDNREAPLTDYYDDSIYMSFGEIPFSSKSETFRDWSH